MATRIVMVGGVHKGAGKTTLTCFLLSRLPGWGALKVTTTHEGTVCPVEASCTACGELVGPYLEVREPGILQQEGTDTWKMGLSGAARVVWLRSTPEALAGALEHALPTFDDLPGVVVEGTNVARHLPGVYVLAARPPVRKIKPSARATAERADLRVLNLLPGWKGGGTDLLESELPAFARPGTLPFRGAEPEAAENSAFLEEVLARLAQ
jgi:molybdopterin-guanine dinucleotide biosynthesis protein